MRPCGKAHAACKCSPEGRSPVRPPQAALREVRGRTIQRHIDAVLVPEGITEPHRHIICSRRADSKLVSDRSFIPERCDTILNGHDAGCAGIIAAVMVDDDIVKLRFLLLAICCQIVPAVVCPRHLRVLVAVRVPSFHVVVHMRERPRHFIVIVPISHERDERLQRLIVREVIHAFQPVLRGVVGLRGAAIGLADIGRQVVNLPVPAVSGHTEEHLLSVHDLGGIIVDALKPGARRHRSRCGACPCHAVTHDGCGIAVIVEVGIHAPVLTADRAVDARHTRQADVHQLRGIICLDRIVDIGKHLRGCRMSGIAIAFFQVYVDAVTPRIFFHDADDLRKEGVLCAVRVIPQSSEDAVVAVIGNRQQPLDMRPLVDVGHHGRDGNARLINLPGSPDFEGEQPDLADAVTVVAQSVIHSGVAHESPHHDFLTLEYIHQSSPPPSSISCIEYKSCADFPCGRDTMCLESHAALY